MNQNWQIKLLIAVLAFGVPALRAILAALARQREQSRLEAMRQQAMEEALRTGRGADGAAPGQPTGADIAADRRKAQLEELRRRARERAAQKPGSDRTTVGPATPVARSAPPASPGPAPIPGGRSSRPAQRVDAPARGAASPPPLRPSARPAARPPATQRPAAGRPAQRPGPAPARRPAPPQPARPPVPLVEEPVHRLVPEAAPTATNAARRDPEAALDLQTAPLADWRRAFVMREVLDAPLALRPPAEAEGRGA